MKAYVQASGTQAQVLALLSLTELQRYKPRLKEQHLCPYMPFYQLQLYVQRRKLLAEYIHSNKLTKFWMTSSSFSRRTAIVPVRSRRSLCTRYCCVVFLTIINTVKFLFTLSVLKKIPAEIGSKTSSTRY